MKKQCQAIAVSTNAQCKMTPLPGSKYCFHHYPKRSAIVAAFLGAILSLILSVIFWNPLSGSLSKYRPFYYLDKERPTITKTSPEINTNSNVFYEMDTLTILAEDEGSGIDFEKSSIAIYRKENHTITKVNCNLDITNATFEIKPSNVLRSGEYSIEFHLVDKASNVVDTLYPLVIKDKENLNVSIQARAYTPTNIKDQFSTFIEKHSDLIEGYQIYVFNVYMHNPTESSFLRDIYVSIDTEAVIFSCVEVGLFQVKGFESYSLAESMDQMLPEERVFLPQRFLKVEEMAPDGLVHISILCGIFKEFEVYFPQSCGVFGTYIYDGYGIREICRIKSWIPIEYQ